MAEVKTRERDGIMLLDAAGDLTAPDEISQQVRLCLNAGQNHMVLNLQNVRYVNSTGLGDIVIAFSSVRREGGALKLLDVPRSFLELLVITRLSELFDIFTHEDDAVSSFGAKRIPRFPSMLAANPSQPIANNSAKPLRVFLCHSSKDKPKVRQLRQHLLRAGVQPWLDEVDILPGQLWEREIPAAVRTSDVILVCLSPIAVSLNGYLQREIRIALDAAEEQSEESMFLIPAKLQECEVPERLRRWQWVSLFDPDGDERLLTSLQARALALSRKPVAPIRFGSEPS